MGKNYEMAKGIYSAERRKFAHKVLPYLLLTVSDFICNFFLQSALLAGTYQLPLSIKAFDFSLANEGN